MGTAISHQQVSADQHCHRPYVGAAVVALGLVHDGVDGPYRLLGSLVVGVGQVEAAVAPAHAVVEAQAQSSAFHPREEIHPSEWKVPPLAVHPLPSQ